MNKHFPFASILALASLAIVGLLFAIYTPPWANAAQTFSLPPIQFGPDIQVNPTSSATAKALLAKNGSLAVNPTNSNHVIASFDNNLDNTLKSGYASSTDAGRTWIGGSFSGPWGDGQLTPLGDTDVDFDGQGTGYYTSLAIAQSLNAYFVLTTTNGIDWSTPVPIAQSGNDQAHFQANLIVDKRTSGPFAGSLYMFWLYVNDISPYYHGISMRYSRDGGRTWSNEIPASDSNNELGRGPSATIATNGYIYVAFEVTDNLFIGNPPKLYLTRSTDGGLSWDTDHLITGAAISPIGVEDFKGRELVLHSSDTCGLLRINHFPSIAVSPTNPDTVYAVWNDSRWEQSLGGCTTPGKHSDIAFSRSTDGGQTWTPASRINDDPIGNGVDQWQPTIATHPKGTVGVTWYDRRYSGSLYFYDLAYTESTDGGLTWEPNVRVSDTSSDPEHVPDYKGIDDLGYHKALAFGPDYVLPGWLDTHQGIREGDFFTDRGTFLLPPTATNTVVPVTTSTSTRTATTIVSPTRTATSTTTPSTCSITFSDVPTDSTFYASIRCLACRGIISGYADGTFRPNNQVTRGQLAKIVSNSAGFAETPTQQTFEDAPPTNTFYQWIERLTARGYMSGYPCGGSGEPCITGKPYFRPFANATRGQTAKIVSNAAGFTEPPSGQTFEDVPLTHTFYDFIQRLASRNVMGGYACGGVGEPCISGKPYFRPGNDVTRGQSAKIVANAFFPSCVIP